jgi:outer membrane lipoprotein-sorting protein
MIQKRNILIILFFLSFPVIVSGCGGGNPVIPPVTFEQVQSYSQIPSDFTLTYDIRDERAVQPYRMIITITKSGTLFFEKNTAVGQSFDKITESATVSEDEILLLYNFLVSHNYFSMLDLYVIRSPFIPIEVIESTARSTVKRVEYHTCPECTTPEAAPVEFRQIIDYMLQLASSYLNSI